ncbi:hypothetical protein [Microvirga massiliensis]|uniref:hypothetical protein n=1 Tax=Microvirga massiliensis TaxID=1033741 RepID=UPI000660B30A|nr:hypothetical protein [Microvirga massiliensis]
MNTDPAGFVITWCLGARVSNKGRQILGSSEYYEIWRDVRRVFWKLRIDGWDYASGQASSVDVVVPNCQRLVAEYRARYGEPELDPAARSK